jgi:outer membrane autotransporter protein
MKSGRLKIGHSCLRVAASVAVVKAILAGLVFGQTWNGGTGNWGTASNWTPATVPNSSNAVSTFNAVTGSSPSVSLTGAPFTVGTLKLNNNVNGGFTFEGGTLRLAGSTQNGGTALVDIQSHDPSPDFDASARIVLQADTEINTVSADSTLTVAGSITDNGSGFSLNVFGPGTVVFTGIGSKLTINSELDLGTLFYDPFPTLGALIIQNGAKVSSVNGSVSAGTLTVTGAGSTWANSGFLSIGVVSFFEGQIAGTMIIRDAGKVLDVNSEISYGAVTVTGAGSAWINSGEIFVGENFNLFPNVGGLLQISNGGTVSAAATTILETGTLAIGGSFSLNSPLTVNGGTVHAIADATLPNNATLDTGGAILDSNGFNLTLSGTLSGPGSVTKVNQGTVILTGSNSYSGGTVLDAGTLVVGNSGALGLGDIVVNGGILGADVLRINVTGNYRQNAGGTLQLDVAGKATGQFDVLNVDGNASLNGTLRILNRGYQPRTGDQLRLINVGGNLSGRFSTLDNPFGLSGGFNTINLIYARNSLTLEFLTLPTAPAVIMTTDFASFALTANQSAIAKQLDNVQLEQKDSKLIDFLQNEPFENLPNDFNKISPESLTALYEISFSAANIQASNLEERFSEIRHGSTGFSSSLNVTNPPQANFEGMDGKTIMEPNKGVMTLSPENRWGMWISGSGDYISVGGDGNANGYDFTTGGVTLGLDYRLTRNLAVGVALGYAHTWTNLSGGGDIDANSGRAGLYAIYYQSGFYLNGYVGGGYNSYDTRRAALAGTASGSTDGGEFNGYVGCGYDFHYGGVTFGPIAALQYTYTDISGNTENGSLAPLQINSQSANSLRTNLGVSASYTAKLGNVQVAPSLRASWQHEYLYSSLPITAQFAGGAGNAFTVVGPAEGHDSALINAGINVQWTPAIGTYFGYNGQVGRSRYDSQGGVCSVHFDF